MKKETRNAKMKIKAKYASSLVHKYPKRQNNTELLSEEIHNTAVPKKRRFSAVSRYILISVLALTLVSTLLVSLTVSWFMMTIEAPGASVTTGHIDATFSIYKLDEFNRLTRYLNESVSSSGSVELYNGLLRNIGGLASSGAIDETYFVVEKGVNSIKLDTKFGFSIESLEGHEISDYVGGFLFKFENISDIVQNNIMNASCSVIDYPDSQRDDEEVTDNERHLSAYVESNAPNNGDEHPLSYISTDFGVNTATNLRNGNLCVYRLSIYLDGAAQNNTNYLNQNFTLKVTLNVGQEGAQAGGITTTTTVLDEAALRKCVASCSPGDSIIIGNDITYNGDLIFNQPVNISIASKKLTVNGNIVFTSSYQGSYNVNISSSAQILVQKVGLTGGRFSIDAPNCTVQLNGTDNASNNDIVVWDDFSISCSSPVAENYDDLSSDTGLLISKIRITDSSGVLKTLCIGNDTRVFVSENTEIGGICSEAGAEVISVVNHGTIGTVNLSSLNALDRRTNWADSVYCTMHMPQIFIDNFGTITNPIVLPNDSFPFYSSTNRGNTRIIWEFNAQPSLADHTVVSGTTNFENRHVETVQNNIVDVYGDGTYLKVYYTDFSDYVLNLHEIFFGESEGNEGYFTLNTNHNINEVVNISVITGVDKVLLDEDYETLRDFSALTTLDLSQATASSGIIPSGALYGMGSLTYLTLPSNTTTLGANMVADTNVRNLYLPAGVFEISIGGAELNGVLYVHPLNDSVYVANLNAGVEGSNRYLFVPATKLNGYRTTYSGMINHIFAEATISNNGNYFYRKTGNSTAEFAVWVGTTDAALALTQYVTINSADNMYYITGFDDYAFDGKLVSDNPSVSINLGLNTASIGAYAFANNTAIRSFSISANSLELISRAAFENCTNLSSVYIDGGNSTASVVFKDYFNNDTATRYLIFGGCSSLSNVTIKNVSYIDEYLFRLTDNSYLRLNSLILQGITTIGSNLLYKSSSVSCSTLTSLEIDSVNRIGELAFSHLDGLTSVYVKNTPRIERYVFSNCSHLKIAACPDTIEIGVNIFEGCSDLEVASLPKLKTISGMSSNDNAANTFASCSSLKVLNIGVPDNSTVTDLFDNNCTDLRLWVIHTETNPGIQPNFFARTVGDKAVVIVDNSFNFGSTNSGKVFYTGAITADQYCWANSSNNENRFVVNGKYLSDYGLGDYLYTITDTTATIWRCILDNVLVDEHMPEIAPTDGNTIVNSLAFSFIDSTNSLNEAPCLILPDSVTRINERGFAQCKLYSIEASNVKTIGFEAFIDSKSLITIRLPRCQGLDYKNITSPTSTKITKTFYGCTDLAVVELGVISTAYNPNTYNYRQSFYDCYNLKLLIFHTETAESGTIINRNPITCGWDFVNNGTYSSATGEKNGPQFLILISNSNNNPANKDFYTGTAWGNRNNRVLCTQSVTANNYRFASDNNSMCNVDTYVLSSGLHLGDIGYGDYLCEVSSSGNSATLVCPLLKDNVISAGSFGGANKYYTPDKTIDNLPIIEIGESAYKEVYFNNYVNLHFSDNNSIVASTAFVGNYGFSGGEVYGKNKSIKTVYFNNVSVLGYGVFRGVITIETVVCGTSMKNLGTNTFDQNDNFPNSVHSIVIDSIKHIEASLLFGGHPANSNLIIEVDSSVYLDYYSTMEFWGGDSIGNYGINTDLLDNGGFFKTRGYLYEDTSSHAKFYYDVYTDKLTGIDGYKLTVIDLTNFSGSALVIPSSFNPQDNGTYKPLLSIVENTFVRLNDSSITSIEFPKYLLSITSDNFTFVPSTVNTYYQTSVDSHYSAPTSGEIELASGFSVQNGILYNADKSILVSVPPAKTAPVGGFGNSLTMIYTNAFYGTCIQNIVIEAQQGKTITMMENAIPESGTIKTITLTGSFILMPNSINGMHYSDSVNNDKFSMTLISHMSGGLIVDYCMFAGKNAIVSDVEDYVIWLPDIITYQYYQKTLISDNEIANHFEIMN